MANAVNPPFLNDRFLLAVGKEALFTGAAIGVGSGLGYGLAAVTGIINPVHGAIYLGVSLVIEIPLKLAENYLISKIFEGRNEQRLLRTIVKIAAWIITFFVSAAISSMIMGAFGIPVIIGTAIFLSSGVVLAGAVLVPTALLLLIAAGEHLSMRSPLDPWADKHPWHQAPDEPPFFGGEEVRRVGRRRRPQGQ